MVLEMTDLALLLMVLCMKSEIMYPWKMFTKTKQIISMKTKEHYIHTFSKFN